MHKLRPAGQCGAYNPMRPYPPELDIATEFANQATVAAEEANLAAGTAEVEKQQFAAQIAIGAKAIKASSEQVDEDLASHTNATQSVEAAQALHTQAGFGPNNEAAGEVTAKLNAALQDLSEERSALAGLQHALALGDAANFEERKTQIYGIDVSVLMEMCTQLLQKQQQLQQRIAQLITARKEEFALVRSIQSMLGKANAAAARAEAATQEHPENSPAVIAYQLRQVEAALADALQALTNVGTAVSKVVTLIDEANDLANQWSSGGPMPDVVPQVQNALNTARQELSLPSADLFDEVRRQVGHSAQNIETAVSVKQTAAEAKDAALENITSTDGSLTAYIVARGG